MRSPAQAPRPPLNPGRRARSAASAADAQREAERICERALGLPWMASRSSSPSTFTTPPKDASETDKRRERRRRAQEGSPNPAGRPRKPDHVGEARLILRRAKWRSRHGKEIKRQPVEVPPGTCLIGRGSVDEPSELCGDAFVEMQCCSATFCTKCFKRHWAQHGKIIQKLPLDTHKCPHCLRRYGSIRQALNTSK